MRYELYSLRCTACQTRNSPLAKACAKCGKPIVSWRRCSLCQSENPPDAFVCLTCYHVLKSKPVVGVLHWRLPWGVPVLIIGLCFGWASFFIAKGWVEAAEAQLEASVANDQYRALQKMEWRAKQSQRSTEADNQEEHPLRNNG